MAFVQRAQTASTPKEIRTLVFGDVRGVDFRSEDTTSYRSPESVNMYRSRRGYWETHPGFRRIGYIGHRVPVWGVHKFTYKDKYDDILTKVLVHAGTKMYLWNNYPEEFTEETLTELFNGLAQRRTKFCEFDEELIIMDGEHLYYFDGEVFDYVSHKAYVPQIYTGKSPDASQGSETSERRSFLTPYVIEGFTPDNTAAVYTLTETDLDADEVYAWTFSNGEKIEYTEVPAIASASGNVFEVNRETGTVTFKTAPQYEVAGVENLYIQYAKSHMGYLRRIEDCTEMMVFDQRLFVTGNPAFPNVVFWSGVNDFTYWDILNYSDRAGKSSAKTIALQFLQENKFLSIKEDSNQDGAYTVWSPYNLDLDSFVTDGSTLYKTYVTAMGVSTKGVVSQYAHKVFLDDNVFLSTNGLNAVSRNLSVSNERNVEHRSTLVDAKLLSEDLKEAMMEECRDYLYILFPNGHCYMANSKYRTTDVSNSVEYEWAYMENVMCNSNKPTQIESFGDSELYVGFEDGHLCKFYFDEENADGSFPNHCYNFIGKPINDYVDTPFSWFGAQNRFKKLNRRYNDLYCDVRTHARMEVLYHTEKSSMTNSKTIPFKADVFSFNEVNFENVSPDDMENGAIKEDYKNPKNFTFNALAPVSFVLRKLRSKRFRRLQIRVKSSGNNCPIVFKSLMVEAYIIKRKLK